MPISWAMDGRRQPWEVSISSPGWPDRGPSQVWGAYTDFINPYHQSSLIMAALLYRRRTGKGVYIDESPIRVRAEIFKGRTFWIIPSTDVSPIVWAIEAPMVFPHGVFRCRGEDRWVAISVFTDEELDRLLPGDREARME